MNCRFAAAILTVCLCCVSHADVHGQVPAMVEFSALGKSQRGIPLLRLTHEMVILGRDGWMHSLDPALPESQIRETNQPFDPISAAELRNELNGEFRRGFEVQATKNFLVVQPEGRGDRWPKLFEQSHRAFVSYMSRRGVEIREGSFPMVAVVLPDEAAMYREFKKLDIEMKRVAGVYAGESNRVITHDGGRRSITEATVRHEAAHQSAYNSGVHSRMSETPRWISEGIGQMFEPAGMTNARTAAQLSDRINQDSLQYIKQNFSGRDDVRFSQAVMQLVSDDTLFQSPDTTAKAYAVAWAMMFYLAERESDHFAKLLNQTSRRPPFRSYPRAERVKDFEQFADCEIFEFSKRVSWYVHSM
ncbi:hypothetical protein K227x_16410 [Rubripirellula lacrimiformis]|uniref:DUF1570 domain-containing protein n=1 Tax=Rubripirellula lacrimiformis TaxID=1930273 RepID=A0A517N7Z3_9BACT|nr:DUF1570 domain-containing protein [Rubripirellula lacrimiformis]QDT03259.1 hypothetical protein K227x_16410 [Rubripirellula lacrimiformis]